VLRESGAAHAEPEPDAAAAAAPPADPNAQSQAAPRPADNPEFFGEAKRRSPALRASLDELVPPYRHLFLDYHRSRSAPWREELANAQDVPLTALRLRIHRLRSAVEKSVVKRMNQRADDARTDSSAPASTAQEAAK
jgi:DNA-directed RNA polymerase specialized sigma24 family protein